MKYHHTFAIVLSSFFGIGLYSIALYGIAYGAQNSVSYVKENIAEVALNEENHTDTTPVVLEVLEDARERDEIGIDSAAVIADTEEEDTLVIETDSVQSVSQNSNTKTIHVVPFYSQFTDITAPEWQKIGCGIASLAMLIDFYSPGEITVDNLLAEGIASNAYISSAGWSHAGLIQLAKNYGLSGEAVYMTDQSMSAAFSSLEKALEEGPVMVSVHYTFKPTNPIPHLAIVTGVENGKVHYNDPAEDSADGTISIEQFKSAWKKRYIAIRP